MYLAQEEPIKVQILKLSSVRLKFTKFLKAFFQVQVSSSSNFASFFSVMTHNSCVFFCLKRNIILTKVADQSAIFQTCTARMVIHQISHVIFGTKSQFFFKLCITFQCHETCTFSSKVHVLFHPKLYMLLAKGAHESATVQTLNSSHEN